MAKKDADLMESGAKVKLGTSDKIIRGFGYIFITLQVHFYTTVNNRSVKDTTNFNKRHSSLR